jgi:pentatricopeptide repeat protein
MIAKVVTMALSIVQLHIFAWNIRLKTYLKDGQPEKGLQLFLQLQREGISPDKFNFIQVDNACAQLQTLEDDMHVHK